MKAPALPFDAVDSLSVNVIRALSVDAVEKAKSGHPGLPMGAAPMAYVAWQRHLKFDPAAPSWPDRDRFVLSAGHGSMLLYSLLHLYGYPLPMEEIRNFRQWGSKTPGHPESFLTAGVEATTGPLGQGAVNAIGMAIAEKSLAHRFNRDGFKIVDHHTIALVSDGDLMEGVVAEGASLAGHLGLGKLTYLYDSNDVTLDGPASLAFSHEDVAKRFESYGWQVQILRDGDHDFESIDRALANAKADGTRPSLILIKTTIGFGSPGKQGKCSSHGSPLGPEETKLAKKTWNLDPEKSFDVPSEAHARFAEAGARGKKAHAEWDALFARYRAAHPDLAKEWDRALSGELPTGWDQGLPEFAPGQDFATRESAGKVLNEIAKKVPELLGGDADLSVSTSTYLKEMGDFDGETGRGRNLHFGVREHAMGSIANGMLYHGGVRSFTATFFCFADYMRPAIRLAALNRLPVIFVFTHDSIGLGEDGPTHQPVEHLMGYRSIPNLHLIRPCDANEAREAWIAAMKRTDGPTALVLSRQKLKTIDRSAGMGQASSLHEGAYVLARESGKDHAVTLLATGSEVEIALESRKLLEEAGIGTRVVSIPSFELFDARGKMAREEVFGRPRLRVSIEAGVAFGWERYIGEEGLAIAVNGYGASAPAPVLLERYGFTAPAIVKRIQERL